MFFREYPGGISASGNASFGNSEAIISYLDINGDGLPDRVSGTEIYLNSGYGLESSYSPTLTISKADNVAWGLGVSGSYGGPGASTYGELLKKLSDDKKAIAESFQVGINVNSAGDESEVLTIDINGDGLVDQVVYNPSGGADGKGASTVNINTGTGFYTHTNVLDRGTSREANQSIGFSGQISVTAAFNMLGLKVGVKANTGASYSTNKLYSSFVDMNGDGLLDFVSTDQKGVLKVHYAQMQKSNLLRSVTNPLNGSFTLDYDLEGNKRGTLQPQVPTERTDDYVQWDMPMGKWVMSSLTLNDGVDLADGSVDQDGDDQMTMTFAYDGGLKSRRERYFMGFTRIATFEADQDPTSTTTRLVSIQKYLEPASINPSDMIAFDYQNGLLDYSSQLLVTENGGNTMVDVISKQKNTYQFREVQISSGASDLGQVSQNNGWVLVKLANLNEASSVFPAVVETEGLTVPDISTPSKGFAQVFEMEYDNYFNVTKYRDKGEVSVSGYTDVVVETVEVNEVLTYTQYNMCDINAFNIVSSTSEYTTYVVYCDDPSYDPVYFNIFTGADNSCVNDLGYDELPCTTEVTPFVTMHTKEVTKTVDITERQWNYSFNGERIAVMTYHDPVSADGRTNVLKSHKIYTTSEHPSKLKRNSETVLTANGKSVATYRTQLNSAGDWAEVDCSYDPTYGNITRVTYPENNIGQRASNTYIYDNTVHQFIEGVSNQFNEFICNTYDYGTGLLLRQVGINGHAMQYTYDQFDRLADVWAPGELSTAGSAPTVSYEYVLNQTVPVAVTYHNTASNSTAQFTPNSSGCTVEILSGRPTISSIPTHVKTATFVDGSGKAVQVKTENSEYNPSTSQNETNILVSGIEQLNQFGQPIQIWAGFKDNTTAFTTISTSDCDLPNGECSVMRNANYDYLHRQIATETWQADNDNSLGVWTVTKTSYGWNHAPASIGTLYGEKTTVFGQNGVPNIQTGKYLDKIGQTIAQVKFGSTDDVTSFTYTQLGELSTVEDALNQITTYTYDMAGRTLTENHPDRGLATNTYDKASNLISMNRASIGAIDFGYSYNRLTTRTMPGSTGNDLYDVVYTYGTAGDGKNGAGRIVTIDQGQGFKVDHYSYDELGQRVVEQSTIQVPQVGQRTYQTQFKYSSFGRILQASYPDGDVVNYHYTDKGELFSIESTAPGEPKLFVVQETQYNGFGQIVTLIYGNGTKTTYNYASSDFVTSGLGHLNKTALFTSTVEGKATLGGATTSLASRDYQYSNLGMVSSLNKSIHSTLAAGITSLDYSFSYDDKGRLLGSTLATGGMNIYELTMGYNAVGGITSKDSDLPNGGHPLVNPNLKYDLSYSYNPAKPHQLLSVTEVGPNGGITNFSYDDVGNLTESFGPSGTEELIWNELQQLSGVMNGNGIHHYVYDHNGERIMKSSINRSWVQVNDQNVDDIQYLEPYTLYVNPYYVVTSFHNGDHISKHYYMNTQRVATDISINYQGPPPPIAPGAPMSSDSAQSTGMGISASFEDDLNIILQQFDAGDLSRSLSENGIVMEKYYPNAASESESINRILYWYHPDYLGSVDLVTDRNGVAYEFFLYTPWGEDMYSYNAGTSNFTSPYRFNGKEKDPETGYGYYGARYYQSKFSVWMSVDPLAHETLEPYVFTGNNAIMLVDPDGRKIDLSGLTSEQVEAYNSIIEDFRSKSDMFDKIYSELESTEKETFYVKTFSSLDEKIRKENNADGAYSSSTNTAYIDLNNGETYINELIHAFQDNLNVYDNDDLTFKEGEGDIIHALISTQLYPDGVVGTAFGMGNLIIDLVESDYSITDEMMITEQVNAIA